ncbi:TraB/GumN family protein [Halorutilales archaeon Cl-col2-1]
MDDSDSDSDEDKDFSPTQRDDPGTETEIETGDSEGEVFLVGTAHVSRESVERVRESIEKEEPDVVAVELDERRYLSMKGENDESLDPRDLLQGFEIFVYWLLSFIQTRLGERFGIEPGADMMEAVETAEENGIPVALVDRDIQITVKRLWSRMTFLEKIKFFGALIAGILGFGGGEEIDVEEIAKGDMVHSLMEEFREFSPRGAEALIDERDAYIASNLVDLRDQGHKVVAVIGAGHKPGIERYLEDPDSIPDVPETVDSGGGLLPFSFSPFKAVGYLISGFVILMFVLLFMAGASNALLARLFVYWFAINGVLSFAGALIAGGRLTSALTGGLVAWMTSINPALAPGWFAGYVELRYTDVSARDITSINETLNDTTLTLREVFSDIYDIPTFRLFLVVALTNVGSIVGTALFVFVLLPYLGTDVDMARLLSRGLANSWDSLTSLF